MIDARPDVRPAAAPSPGIGGTGSHLTWALVWWRWLACAVAALVWSGSGQDGARGVVLIGAAVLATAVVTAAGRRGWEAVRRHPALLVPDLLLAALLIALGGVDTFLLYALAPVLAGGILLPRGLGLAVAPAALLGACTILTLAGLRPPGGPQPGALTWAVAAGAVLACLVLAEAVRAANRAAEDAACEAALRTSLERKNLELLQRNRELQAFEEIASTMQTTMDVTEVQERVVVGVTELLGYPRAVLGLCDPTETRMTGWLAATGGRRAPGVGHLFDLDLRARDGVLTRALEQRAPSMVGAEDSESDADRRLLELFGPVPRSIVVVPVRCRGHLVGGLLVQAPADGASLDAETSAILERLATQAGLALSNVRLCVERTQKLTQEQERMRIASDMHDGIAQALFGIVYQLDGCARLAGSGSPMRRQLEELGQVAQDALEEVRHAIFDIWPAHLTESELLAELGSSVQSLAPGLTLRTAVPAGFGSLDVDLRKVIFRIAQEAVTNTAKHACARQVRVQVGIAVEEASVEITDDGVGVPEVDGRLPQRGFGLRSMAERVRAAGGTLTVERLAEGGTRVLARLPRLSCRVD
ncbi:MAG TPA: GAF domain-containing sensor histidine kinase [Candidatus Dormibacteraeota bacterium]|nr:GAF domain-containing sensor histidine kinase [Candidatus Dormibacteraeota bacterium]